MQFKRGDYVVGWTPSGDRVEGTLYRVETYRVLRYAVLLYEAGGVAWCQRVEHYKTYTLRDYFGLNTPTPCN
jgi:hypothetical protein